MYSSLSNQDAFAITHAKRINSAISKSRFFHSPSYAKLISEIGNISSMIQGCHHYHLLLTAHVYNQNCHHFFNVLALVSKEFSKLFIKQINPGFDDVS